MLKKIKDIWNKYGFEIVLVGCIVIILILSLFRIGKKGSWSSSYIYNSNNLDKLYSVNKRGPPKESKGEKECRRVLQKYFNKPFDKARPDFLRNPVTGGDFNLELDCYEESLGLACEYQGIQHYKYVPYFHKNKEAFLNQKYRDDMKKRICSQYGIRLIEVSYNVKVCDIEKYIMNKLRSYGY